MQGGVEGMVELHVRWMCGRDGDTEVCVCVCGIRRSVQQHVERRYYLISYLTTQHKCHDLSFPSKATTPMQI